MILLEEFEAPSSRRLSCVRLARTERSGCSPDSRQDAGSTKTCRCSSRALRFVVRIGFVDGKTGEIVRHFEYVLVTVVPQGGSFVDHHHTLLRKP